MASPGKSARQGRHRAAPATTGRTRVLSTKAWLTLPAVVLATAVSVGAYSAIGARTGAEGTHTTPPAVSDEGVGGAALPAQPPPARPTSSAAPGAGASPAVIPGLGPAMAARVPADAHQLVLVTGQGKNSSRSQVVLYRRTDSGWLGGAAWPAHNALKGWTADHRLDDLRSPVGVFTLSDAGGLLSDPGSKLPYTHSGGFSVSGSGFEGEPLAGSFDYVIAIDYNHVKGTSPLDWGRPLGAAKGGGIWLHVDHGGPTHACVSIAETHMKELLRALDPGLHPVIAMGDAASLAE
ncbi:hypothetical protein ABTY96_45300 [Streptomyces sp. NPDC096057]|uniref:hypothetical protein n=1 Tax=Streptomyces sp. NPDC096057 TaxID=3155543 RepID=UPI0033323349